MAKIIAGEARSDAEEADRQRAAAAAPEFGIEAARVVARARWLLIISGLTTLIAIAAVITVIGYRVFRAGGSAAARAEGVITLPKGARVVGATVADQHVVVTIDIAGTSEVRLFDLKTLRETGRLRFATEP